LLSETEPGIAHAILGGSIDFTREPWPSVSTMAKSLIRGMLESDPRRRLTPQQVLGMTVFQKLSKVSKKFRISLKCGLFRKTDGIKRLKKKLSIGKFTNDY
jgi:serine/threonine protein kinase